jgi:hypothetical protein
MQATLAEVKWQRRALITASSLLGAIIALAVIVLAGWFVNDSAMKRIGMAPNAVPSSTALGLAVFAIISLVTQKRSSPLNLAGGIVLSLAALATLVESVMSADYGLAFPIGPQHEDVAGITFPGPMAPNISIELVLLGIALALPQRHLAGKPIGQSCALIVLLASLTALMGHALGVEFMCTFVGCIKIPAVSSALFAATSAAFILCHPQVGAMRTLCADNISGSLSRKLSLALLVVPLALAARAVAVSSGVIDQNFGWFLFGGTMLAMMWQTIGFSAQNLAQVDKAKNEVEKRLLDSSAALDKMSRVASQLQTNLVAPRLKKVCLSCAKTYAEDLETCPDDNDKLVAVADDSLEGRIFAERYMVTDYIGRGGMCAVYKAKHVYMEKVVAVKVLLRHLASDPPSLKRFQREAKSASMLNHPNLLEVYDFGVTIEGQAFIVMEFVEGKSLDDLLEMGSNTCSVPEFVDICTQICEGLQHAHENGVIHRDLKPSNIMMRERDGKRILQIVDFGLAKVLDDAAASKITNSSQVVGSPVYMGPEQYTDYELGPHVDVYALGCMMYELLTGMPPFTGESISAIVHKHLNQPAPPLSESIGLPPDLSECIRQTLDKDPKQRPTVEQILEQLRACQIALA